MAHNGAPSAQTPQNASTSQSQPPRVVLAGESARILCVADIRGDYHELNRLIKVHDATAVIHTGDFGFNELASLERMGDRIIRHLVRYSPLLSPTTRAQFSAPNLSKEELVSEISQAVPFPLSQFPLLLTGAITFPVPVFTVWGLVEDVRVLEKFRTGEYEVRNLTVLDEVLSKVIDVAGLRLRLFGLGGAFIMHRMFDNGEGLATIAGGQGTVWQTALQIGELVDTAQRVYDPSETRILITHAPVSREGFLTQLALVLKADMTISSGMHFRYGAGYNDFIVHPDFDSYIRKLSHSRTDFKGVWESVKDRVEVAMNPYQTSLLQKTQAVAERVPTSDDGVWKNTWNWQLADASCSQLLLSIADGRVSSEIKSTGLSFSHRISQTSAPSSTTAQAPVVSSRPADGLVKQSLAARIAPAEPSKPASVPAPAPVSNGHVIPKKPSTTSAPPTQPKTSAVPAKPPVSTATGPPKASSSATVKPVETNVPPKPANGVAKGRESPAGPNPRNGPVNGKSSADRGKPTTPAPTAAPSPPVPTPTASTSTPAESTADGEKPTAAADGIPTKPAFQPRQHNPNTLFVKNIPVPCTEQEIKDVFTAGADKITLVKLLHDPIQRRQKTFCYVEYANEDDLKEGLANHKDKIRDTVIDISISNPPAAREDGGFRGRPRGRGRGAHRGGLSRGGGPSSASPAPAAA